jgi:NADH dehydrogenase
MNNRRTTRVLITGASGYIGDRLVAAARERGHDVVAGVREVRSAVSGAGLEWRKFDLRDGAEAAVRGVDAVIHLAAVLNPNGRSSGPTADVNVTGARALLQAARREGVRRFVFISSQSAAADSPTRYGQSKFEIEQLLTGPGECAVRTGLVCGGPPRGLYGTLLRLCRRSALLPMLRPGAPVHPVHVDDVCDSLLSLIECEVEPPRLVRIGTTGSVRFGDFVRRLAWQRLGRRVRLVPVPTTPLLWLARVASRIPSLPAISRERILGLAALRPMEPSIPVIAGARPLRDVDRALALEGRRRRLLAEGATLMRYVAAKHASRGATRRYVRAVQASDDAEPMDFGVLVQAWPSLLRLSEPIGGPPASRLSKRLALATRIVEMTPRAAPLFHAYGDRTRLWGWLGLLWLLAVEGVLLPVRWIAARRWRRDS